MPMNLTVIQTLPVLFVGIGLLAQIAHAGVSSDIAVYRGADRQARLEKGAKAEGEFVWYTSVNDDDIRRIIELFEKRYPFIKAKPVRLTSARIIQRFIAETQANTYLADLLDTNETTIEFFRRKNVIQPYYTPMAEKFDKRFIQPQGYWVASRVTMLVLGYNTRLVKAAEAPRRYEDLLDAKWKDQLALEREDSPWFMTLMEHWGEQKGRAFFQRLKAQNPKIRSGHTHLAQLIAAGEDPLSPNIHSQGIATGQRRGAPVEWTNLEPVVASSNASALAKNPPHPNAALLFLDFILGKETGQRIIRDVNRIPTHPEVFPNPPRLREGFEFITIDPVKFNDKIDYYTKLWHEWFVH
jgi:iron(III) transport system substrate-binding protein